MGSGGGSYEKDLNLEATELRLGLPGTTSSTAATDQEPEARQARNNKRSLVDRCEEEASEDASRALQKDHDSAPSSKAQIVGWPPIRSYRKNSLQTKKAETETSSSGIYVKVSMDGAPYLRKIDLNVYKGYSNLLKALENMFKFTIGEYSEREGYKGSEFAPTYEDKDGDWMLMGDVPWEMFMTSCKKLRIMRGSEARGLGCAV
ncbi:auxin-induced protein 22D-like [Syzygium oleosum]|uniref:auxin-induced protein 22D-like n=1 Tax=Syzygium oleosum TaxID=219896 RepID=UPI0011D28844|nr:auxin-induced protein 22D-like [Syzygium oleosum]